MGGRADRDGGGRGGGLIPCDTRVAAHTCSAFKKAGSAADGRPRHVSDRRVGQIPTPILSETEFTLAALYSTPSRALDTCSVAPTIAWAPSTCDAVRDPIAQLCRGGDEGVVHDGSAAVTA